MPYFYTTCQFYEITVQVRTFCLAAGGNKSLFKQKAPKNKGRLMITSVLFLSAFLQRVLIYLILQNATCCICGDHI